MDEISYKERISNFLKDERYYSLLISGKWGVGKTYLWKEIEKLPELPKAYKQKDIIYVSLFGKESYKEVLEEVVLKAYHRNKWLNLFKSIKYKEIPIGTFLTSLFINEDFENKIVCFDDIERKTEDFKIKDFLGLVYRLKEEKCKVIAISNIDEISNESESEIFEKYKEKTFDLDFEVKSKEEVINQILEEKLGKKREYEEHYKGLIPNNIYQIENLRNLNKIIEAFKFFNEELNFRNKLKEKKDFRDLFTYVFEIVVVKINDDKKSKNKNDSEVKTEQRFTLEKSKNIINSMIESYLKNSTFHISLLTKEQFEEEIKNYHFYTLRKELIAEFDIVLRNKDYCDERKNKVEDIINKMEEKKYIEKFVNQLYRYDKIGIIDFLSIVKVLNLNSNAVKNIKKEMLGRTYYGDKGKTIEIICGDDEELKQYSIKLLKKSKRYTNFQPQKPQEYETLKKIFEKICNYESFTKLFEQNKEFENKEFEEAIKDNKIKEAIKNNKIILEYIRCFHYYGGMLEKQQILYEIWLENQS